MSVISYQKIKLVTIYHQIKIKNKLLESYQKTVRILINQMSLSSYQKVRTKMKPQKDKKAQKRYSNRKFKTQLGISYGYIKSIELKSSLPYPSEGCNCGIFSIFFYSYNNETKRKLLKDKNDNNILYGEVQWKWDDWDLPYITNNH